MSRPPTPRQVEVLEAIAAFHATHGIPPTMRELCRMLEIGSTNAVSDFLKALEKKGLVRRHKGLSRGTLITEEGRKAL